MMIRGFRPLQCSVRSAATAVGARSGRLYAQRYASSVPPASSSRISTVFGALLVVGVATTTFGLYEFYSSFTMWPKEVRSDLRAGVKAKHQGDLDLSQRYLQRAWETAQTLPTSSFGSAPQLKITGILITLAEVLEANKQPEIAYELLSEFLDKLPPRDTWTGPERMRLVAMAYKLGEMANTYSQPPQEEEKRLVWSVTELLSTLREQQAKTKSGITEVSPTLHELELPDWVVKTDVVAPLQALGEYYSKVGNIGYATTLYGQLIHLLIEDGSMEKTSPTDRCRAAQVMTNLSELMTRQSLGTEAQDEKNHLLEQAEYWAVSAVKFVTSVSELEESKQLGDVSGCVEGLAVMFSNLGTVNMMKGQPVMARQLFEVGLAHAVKVGFKDQAVQVRRLLIEAQRAESKLEK